MRAMCISGYGTCACFCFFSFAGHTCLLFLFFSLQVVPVASLLTPSPLLKSPHLHPVSLVGAREIVCEPWLLWLVVALTLLLTHLNLHLTQTLLLESPHLRLMASVSEGCRAAGALWLPVLHHVSWHNTFCAQIFMRHLLLQ